MKKIDCHTHIINEEIKNEYFSRTDGYALVMEFAQSLFACPDVLRTVQSDARLFFCPCIDLKQPIAPRLARIEEHLDDWKVAGLKIYTSYQRGRATDKALQPVFAFAAKHRLGVTFHTGLCSLVLPSEQDLEGSSARHIAAAAQGYPGVTFVAAHMDDPHMADCCRLCAGHANLFTDFSGLFEEGYESDWHALLTQYGGAMRQSDAAEGCLSQILYGTDFCPPIGLNDIERFDRFLAELFSEKEREDIYWNNALRAFPRLSELLA